MDKELTENPAMDQETSSEKQTAAKKGSGLVYLALFLALVSLGGTAWMWWQNQSEQSSSSEQIATAMSRQAQRLEGLENRMGGLESNLSDVAGRDPGQKLNQLEQGLRALQGFEADGRLFHNESSALTRSIQAEMEESNRRLQGAEARLTSLSNRQMDSDTELDLAEVDYILRLAQERLQLFGDVRTADQALEIADRHIAAFDNPMYIGVRSELATARQQLSQVETFDYQSLDRHIDELQQSLIDLVFKGGEPTRTATELVEESGWWSRIKNAFSGLVTVRKSSQEELASPLVADQELIRQRAWLELEVARLAAMRTDQSSYLAALDRFSSSLGRWFDASDQSTQSAVERLSVLTALNTHPELPDVSAPWVALQAIRNTGVPAKPANEAAELPEVQVESTPEAISEAVSEDSQAEESDAEDPNA